MFTILDRYIGSAILWTSLLVLLVLTALAGIFAFIGELEDVGKGSYTVGRALQYVLLTSPGKSYLLFAPAVLLGSLLGLGALAQHSELTVMRAAGISNGRIIRAVLLTGIALMSLVVVVGETIMPKAEQLAEQLRLTALEQQLSVKGQNGLWVKSGERFVNIRTVLPDFTLLDVQLLQFHADRLVESMKVARIVPLADDDWLLDDVRSTRIDFAGTTVVEMDEQHWSDIVGSQALGTEAGRLVNADVLKSLSVSPDTLSIRDLYQQIGYLRENQLDARHIELALWVKLTSPFATVVMLMLSLPFVFSSQRSGGAGQKIFIGIMLGVVYVLLNKLLSQLALSTGMPPALSAVLPLLAFLALALYGIRRSA